MIKFQKPFLTSVASCESKNQICFRIIPRFETDKLTKKDKWVN